MNLKIQAFAEQAKNSVPHGLSVDKWIEVYNQKFGELIIRECADIADAPTSQPFQSYGQKIKQYFGIEQ